ncbi:MAG: GntG family PLP-dependent aldolase [Cytophagales bacterium]|nr:GntG family PLP-dependent aldolase [Cytophagales bacterium]
MMIDLRSDTVTKPTKGMQEAMFSAEVGDDVFESDPSVNALQAKVADLFGMEAALYCPSGTMTNQIGLRILTQPQDEVVCHKHSHIYLYEGGGLAYNSMLSPKLLEGDRGRLTADQIATSINPDDIHFPRTQLVSLENTMNKGGGSYYSLEELRKIHAVCDEHGLALHLDGARLFNAIVESGISPKDFGDIFDTISVCFSKGLGAPVGSVLLGTKSNIKQARRVRKVFGGGMRQAGFLAAACSYALDHHVDRLKEDHDRARTIGDEAAKISYVKEVYPVDTNIVILALEGKSEKWMLDQLSANGVAAVGFGPGLVRFVTHLDFTNAHLEELIKVFKKIS